MDETKMSLIEKAKAIIDGSSLSAKDKQLVNERIPYASAPLLEVFVQSCSGSAFMLELVVRSFKRKLVANDNPQKMRAIMKAERSELRRFVHVSA